VPAKRYECPSINNPIIIKIISSTKLSLFLHFKPLFNYHRIILNDCTLISWSFKIQVSNYDCKFAYRKESMLARWKKWPGICAFRACCFQGNLLFEFIPGYKVSQRDAPRLFTSASIFSDCKPSRCYTGNFHLLIIHEESLFTPT